MPVTRQLICFLLFSSLVPSLIFYLFTHLYNPMLLVLMTFFNTMLALISFHKRFPESIPAKITEPNLKLLFPLCLQNFSADSDKYPAATNILIRCSFIFSLNNTVCFLYCLLAQILPVFICILPKILKLFHI